MSSKSSNLLLGRIGEKLVLKFLLQQGFELICQNYTIRGGEIDLIMKKDSLLLFIEVKTRQSTKFGLPEESVTYLKKRNLLRAIYTYLSEKKWNMVWRCDVVAIEFSPSFSVLRYFKNIFTA